LRLAHMDFSLQQLLDQIHLFTDAAKADV
jgi:hypothetical protein